MNGRRLIYAALSITLLLIILMVIPFEGGNNAHWTLSFLGGFHPLFVHLPIGILLGLFVLEFLDFVPPKLMPDIIAEADICLGGHFGRSDKAMRVISGKTFQDIAMGKPTIVGDSPANRELLTHGYDAWFCRMNSPEDLALGIKTLAANPEDRLMIGANARQTFIENASLEVQTPKLKAIIEKVIPP